MKRRKYPVGIQTFSRLREEGYVYVDKTDFVWQMTQEDNPFLFLSRPRRFGKSLLVTTLCAFYEGRKDLFEGLKVMDLEQEWRQYPVLHVDLSTAKNELTGSELRDRMMWILRPLVRIYGCDENANSPGTIMEALIHRAFELTKTQVVVIIDEYDAPLLGVLDDEAVLNDMRRVLQEFYTPLKANERFIKRCFITGITKFSQLSIFSTINNLTNITMLPKYAALCGITEEELTTTLAPDIALLAETYGCTPEEMHQKLKERYDGYMFSEDAPEVYNPFSLFKAFSSKKVGYYWFESGTPTFLIRQMQKFRTDITAINNIEVSSTAFDKPTEAMTTALPLLYQSGYLTIKGYDREMEAYTLGFPNQEVQTGYADGLMPTYIGLEGSNVQMGFAAKFWKSLKHNDIDQAMREMQAYLAGIPYVEGFKKKLEETAVKEGFWEYTLYLIFSMLNVYVRTQVKCLGGRTDMVVWMPDTTYVFELKISGTAREALQQIDQKRYSLPYKTDGRRVVKVGVKCNADNRAIEDWIVSS